MLDAKVILKQNWGFDSFRGIQESIIQNVVAGKDILAILPTGGGKSIAFQVPALMRPGLCLVVSPLIALMQDQVANLSDKAIPAAMLHTGMSASQVDKILTLAVRGQLKFLYVSPERLDSPKFLDWMSDCDITLLAVDEAHCISQWGYDFRPSYLKINRIRKLFPKLNVIALTASATPSVQKDIAKRLNFIDFEILKQSFRRPNLSYAVLKVENKFRKLSELIYKFKHSGIIYCNTRKRVELVCAELQKMNPSIDVDFYHAGLSQQEREKRQAHWKENASSCIVCTNAFGMGIDKPDVEYVIHYDSPDSVEAYYQEAGRAGRNGEKAFAILLLEQRDLLNLEQQPDLHFPDFEVIKKIYQHIGDFLQIPVGSGEDLFYDFDLETFIRNFKLNSFQVIYAIKALEQQGFLMLNDSVFLPSKVGFTTSRGIIETFLHMHPKEGRVVNCLLRLYEGIYNYNTRISEERVAKYCHLEEQEVVKILQFLQRQQILRYYPHKENPQMYFPMNRASIGYMNFNFKTYQFRRERYELQIRKILQYLRLEDDCRAQFIAKYFGEKSAKKCGVCDNCVRAERKLNANLEKSIVVQDLYAFVKANDGVLMSEMRQFFGKVDENSWQNMMRYLLKEKLIRVSIEGFVFNEK